VTGSTLDSATNFPYAN